MSIKSASMACSPVRAKGPAVCQREDLGHSLNPGVITRRIRQCEDRRPEWSPAVFTPVFTPDGSSALLNAGDFPAATWELSVSSAVAYTAASYWPQIASVAPTSCSSAEPKLRAVEVTDAGLSRDARG
jgi:hypothetical protein